MNTIRCVDCVLKSIIIKSDGVQFLVSMAWLTAIDNFNDERVGVHDRLFKKEPGRNNAARHGEGEEEAQWVSTHHWITPYHLKLTGT